MVPVVSPWIGTLGGLSSQGRLAPRDTLPRPAGQSAYAGAPIRGATNSYISYEFAEREQIVKVTMPRLILSVAAGALLGYLYYRFVGCRTGACPLTGNPYIATLYGAAIGFLAGRA